MSPNSLVCHQNSIPSMTGLGAPSNVTGHKFGTRRRSRSDRPGCRRPGLLAPAGRAAREHRPERLCEAVYAHCRTLQIEPPAAKRVERVVRSALHSYEDQLQEQALARLGAAGLAQIDSLLTLPGGQHRGDRSRHHLIRMTQVSSSCATSRPIPAGRAWRVCCSRSPAATHPAGDAA